MEDWRTVVRLLDKGMFMAKIDLTDAYHLVNVDKESRRLLRFGFQNILYEYTCLCFGLSTAPFVFTKIMKEVVRKLRKMGYLSVIYLDDILLLATTYEKCLENVNATVSLLRELGFIISDKSVMIPSKQIEFLGLNFDSIKMTVSLPERKVNQIKKLCQKLAFNKNTQIRNIAEAIGILVAATPGANYSPLYTRQIEHDKSRALELSHGNYDSYMTLSADSISDLKWWESHVTILCLVPSYNFAFTIFTDASLLGWGASTSTDCVKGTWSATEKRFHINALELMAVENALKYFVAIKTKIQILLRVDNKTAISYINKYGGCRSPVLHSIAKRIWQWCETRNISLTASYINTSDNVVADSLSRGEQINSEWKLHEKYFTRICKKFGSPDIDLFASNANKQVKQFYSWFPDSNSLGVDAFLCSWDFVLPYAFPPFSMVPKILQKIKNDNAKIILVVPNWPSQPWYPLYHSLCISETIRLGPDKSLLYCPLSRRNHPIKSLELIAAILSGRPSNKNNYKPIQST